MNTIYAGEGDRHTQASSSELTTPMGPPLQARGKGHMIRCNIAHCKDGLECSADAEAKTFLYGAVSKMHVIKAFMLAVVTGLRIITTASLGRV